ncbi:MAG: extracellular solute-binding protein [Phycisphaeraceae bacterium]|nr:extracellular solute-binding protein [Phycisphaeraceae bacterium]
MRSERARPGARDAGRPGRRSPARIVRLVAFAVIAVSAAASCRPSDRADVVLYASIDDYVIRDVIRLFNRAHPEIRVRVVGDSEAVKTTGLVERIRAERTRPVADVFWSGEVFQTIALADDGLLAPHVSAASDAVPSGLRDPDRRWHGFAGRPRAIVYAPQRVAADEIPTTWMMLAQSRYRGRLAMADPRFGTTGGHLGAMKAYWDRHAGPGYYGAWLSGLAENRIRLLPSGNAGVVRAVLDGEVDLGLTDGDDIWVMQDRGHDLGVVFPAHSGEDGPGTGTLVIPSTVAVVAGGPNPDAARLLADFLLSPEVELCIAGTSSRNVPVLAPVPAELVPYVPGDRLEIDYRRAAGQRTDAIRMAMEQLAGGAR